ncbi:hypothetical protein [Consotaella salsifontis]|uniref:Phospholipase n=1 Tax=Consotaella salsifontis TaxID=1365950 RepID=A0A1T4LSC9_9HYPH|nr:hypothetical protein [Consotaella salsifontis]SJZ57613.1 hypothetical protein SAMN05428963_101351 [Consotaella salsifontis]
MGGLLIAVASAQGAAAEPLVLPPFKDALFAYPGLTAYRDDGAFVDVDYSEARDIDQRDEIPERKAKRQYVSTIASGQKAEQTLTTSAGPLAIATVGNHERPRAVVVFIHGRGGDHRLGMNDWTFGGNFNRLKNLMIGVDGLYVTADAGSFSSADGGRIEELLKALSRRFGAAPLVLACGSMGGELCWSLAMQPFFGKAVDAFMVLGGNSSLERFRHMQAAAGHLIPMVLAHGTRDTVYPWERQTRAFDEIRRAYPKEAIRFVSFDGGTHGTPIRMIDWREELNWLFARLD